MRIELSVLDIVVCVSIGIIFGAKVGAWLALGLSAIVLINNTINKG